MGTKSPLLRRLLQNLTLADLKNEQPETYAHHMERAYTRREFLKKSSMVAAAFALASCATGRSARAHQVRAWPALKNQEPVAILGGGLAGLTLAYELCKRGIPCEIYEAADRLGGRVFTQYDFNGDDMFCEMGGELIDSHQKDIQNLAMELGLKVQPLKAEDNGTDIYFFKDQRYTNQELIPAFEPLAKNIRKIKSTLYTADEDFTPAAHHWDRVTLAEYLKTASKGTDAWLIKMLEVAYVCEYGLETAHQSSLNLIDFVGLDLKNFSLFGESDEAWRIEGGNSRLVEALKEEIKGRVPTFTGHQLVKVENKSEQTQLSFVRKGQSALDLKRSRVACTLPLTVLREVEGIYQQSPLNGAQKRIVREATYGMNAKMMMSLKHRVWKDALPGMRCSGEIFTDLSFQSTWDTSRGQAGRRGIMTYFLGGDKARELKAHKASDFARECNEIFPGFQQEREVDSLAMMNWSLAPHVKASYSSPGRGQYAGFYEPMLDGNEKSRWIFAGEHCSVENQGFMQGAVDTALRAAKQLAGEKVESAREIMFREAMEA